MFLTPQPTPFDLRMRILWTDVRIHPGFWIVAAVLGWNRYFDSPQGNIGYLMLWILVVLFSILVHEFGHVIMGRLFGSDAHIILHTFGGLAVGIVVFRRWQRVLVSLGGPLAQLLLFGLVLVVAPAALAIAPPAYREPVAELLDMLLMINLVWPLLNLLPIYPLDGGQIAKEVLEAIFGTRGFAHALLLSMMTAGGIAILCLLIMRDRSLIRFLAGFGNLWNFILFAMLAVGSFQAWQVENDRRGPDDRLPWE